MCLVNALHVPCIDLHVRLHVKWRHRLRSPSAPHSWWACLLRQLVVLLGAMHVAASPRVQKREGSDALAPAPAAWVRFDELSAAARARGEIAIGVQRAGEKQPRLNPPRGMRLRLQHGDQLVLIGDAL